MAEEDEGKQTPTTEEGTEAPKDDSGNGVSNETPDVVAEARQIRDDLRKENDRREELLKKEESLIARREALAELGGNSKTGTPTPKQPTPKDYANKVMSGKLE